MIRWGGTLLPSGNRAGDGMVCNSNNRRQWRKQGVAVGAAASRHKCHYWVPQPVRICVESSRLARPSITQECSTLVKMPEKCLLN